MKAFKAFAQKGIYMEEVCYYSEKEKAKTFIKEWLKKNNLDGYFNSMGYGYDYVKTDCFTVYIKEIEVEE